MKKPLAPIVLFVYNRPWHTQQTVEALQKNELAIDSDLFIFADGTKNLDSTGKVEEVRQYLKTITGFKSVVIEESQVNKGLATSIINGVTKVVNQYGKVIVMEDDLVSSPYFLSFMNESLEAFVDDERISSITGYNFNLTKLGFPNKIESEIFLNIRPMSWSWGTWIDRWSNINWENEYLVNVNNSKYFKSKINQGGTDLIRMANHQISGLVNSWYIRWCYNNILSNKYTVYPIKSLIQNIGHDGSGVHCGMDKTGTFSCSIVNSEKSPKIKKNIEPDWNLIKKFNKVFNIRFRSKIKEFIVKFIK